MTRRTGVASSGMDGGGGAMPEERAERPDDHVEDVAGVAGPDDEQPPQPSPEDEYVPL